MTNTFNWKTPKGAKIEATITVEHITSEQRSADGWEYTAKCDRWERKIDKLTVNGEERVGSFTFYGPETVIEFYVGEQRCLIRIPKEITDALFGEERAERKRRLEAAEKAEAKYETRHNAVLKAMDNE